MASHPRLRAALLAGSALVAPGAMAQTVAPDARPQLDRVIAGGITIRQDATQTQVTQTQQRGIVDWRRFDVGRDHTVQFQQPDRGSITLNRVTTPDPSVIAGRVQANGQVAIVNQAGIVVSQGARIEAAGLIASTADISNQNFLAGRMQFDRAGRPDARIENNGSITVREAGLAALVAPQVVNRGTITARLGRVALAGAETHVVDLHGDGLLAIEITGPVRQAPAGGAALVTNSGVIEAEGGRIQLTARAADGIVQDLVRAGGRIAADTDAATGRRGDVVISGTGGAIRIEGDVRATGVAPGTRGGAVEIVGDRVLVDRGARVDASGAAGGGEVALGTTRRGAAQPRLARRTGVSEGAVVRADATERGNGGIIIVNSSELTIQAGVVSARGGAAGGDGGFVEISGQSGFRLPGAVDVSAPAGQAGTILIDPVDLTIVASGDPRANVSQSDFIDGVLGAGTGPADAFLPNSVIQFVLTGNVRLEATRDIFVNAPLIGNTSPPGAGTLTLDAGRNIAVNDAIFGFPDVALIARTGGIALNGVIDTSGTLSMTAGPGGITQTARFRALRLEVSTTGSALLNFDPSPTTAPSNELGTLGPSSVAGNFALRTTPYDFDASTLNIQGTVSVGGRLSLDHSGPIAQAAPSVIRAAELVATTPGSISLLGDNAVAAVAGLTGSAQVTLRNVQRTTVTGAVTSDQSGVQITAESGDLVVAAPVTGNSFVTLAAAGNLSLTTTGSVSATSGRGSVEMIGGAAFTAGVPNTDTTSAGALSLAGDVSAPGGTVILGAGTGGIRQTAGGITTNLLTVLSGGVALLGSPSNAVTSLNRLSAAGDFVLDNGSTDLTVVTGPLTESAPGTAATIGVRTSGTVFLVANAALEAPGAGGRISLRTGRVAIDAGFSATAATLELAPFAAAPLTIPVTTPTGSGFEVTAADLAAFSGVQTLRLGGTTFDGVLTPSASSVTFVGPLAFGGTLDVRSLGSVAQNAGADLAVGTLTGAAGGNIVLANAGNAIGSLGDLAAGSALTLRNGAALSIPAGRTVSAGGALDIATLAGGLTVDGTVTGATTSLTAAGALIVNGFSAIARSGDLTLTGQSFALNGLAAAAGNIVVNAATTASLAGTAQTPNTLRIAAPATSFGGLNARTAQVLLALGDAGTATGTLDAGGLTVQGGRGAVLRGTIAGTPGPFAAALGRRATAQGVLLGDPPPQPDDFTFNGCPIGLAFCGFPPVAFPFANPLEVTAVLDPLVGTPFALQVRPPTPEIVLRPARDRGEEDDLAPPDIRGGDY